METIIQFMNSTPWNITLCDDKGRTLYKTFEPGQIKNVSMKPLHRRCEECFSNDWEVGVLRNGRYVNIHILGKDLYLPRRISFKTDISKQGKKILCIEGIAHNPKSDWLLDNKYVGSLFMRNKIWDKRPTYIMDRESEGPYKQPTPLFDFPMLHNIDDFITTCF